MAQGGILCRQVMRKAGIFLLPPPRTHVLHLPLSSTRFKPELFAQALSSPERALVVLGAALRCSVKPAPQGLGTRKPGIRRLGGRTRCDLIGGHPGLGEGWHRCCGMQGCRMLCSSIPRQ